MSRSRLGLAVLLLALALPGARRLLAAAEPPPAAVTKAAAALFGKQAVTYTKEHEDGVTVYEAAVKTKLEVVFEASGAVRETEVAVPSGTLPSAVAAAVNGKLDKGARVVGAEVLIRPDGVAFEVETRTSSGAEIEYLVDASGKLLAEEREDDGDDAEEDDDD